MNRNRLGILVAAAVVLGSCTATGCAYQAAVKTLQAAAASVATATVGPAAVAGSTTARRTSPALASGRLRGKVIVIDPGHQLGNATHPRQINRLVNAGGFEKACNTSGTATNSGFPEATFSWLVAQSLKRQLQAHGATVYLTRHTNSYADWGPCIDARGRAGNRVHADAFVSIHGDGAAPSARGFFVIRPGIRNGWTDDIYRVSHRFAVRVKAGLVAARVRVSNAYGGDGFDVRRDLGTLNWSNVPVVMVELGNMRNAADARQMTSPPYRRHRYARGLRFGIADFVRHR